MKRVVVWALGVCLSVGVMGCGGGGDDGPAADEFEFVNSSSQVVQVTPGAGESFAAFSLNPGDSKTVKYEGDAIGFFHSGGVTVDRVAGENVAVFRD